MSRALSTCARRLQSKMSWIKPSSHVSQQDKDVWTLINTTAAEAEAALGKPVANLGQGFFSYSPPKFAIDAAKKAFDVPSQNQYSPTRGRPQLQKAIADAYNPLFKGYNINPKTDVVVTAGANEGMYSAFTAFLDQGDEAIVFEPYFDQYIPNIKLPGGKVKYVPLHPPKDADTRSSSANEWSIDWEEFEQAITPRTKIVVLNSPHNPLGKVFTREELQRIGDTCVKHGIIILSDEVYDRLYYSEFTRIATLSPEIYQHTLTVGSGGKTFAATGWRIGWLIGPAELIKWVAAAHTRIVFSINSPCQVAITEAFEQAPKHDYYNKTIEAFKGKIKRFTSVFDELGLTYSIPEGGYFVLVNFSRVKVPADWKVPEEVAHRPRDFALAIWLIYTLGVVAIPPSEFTTPRAAPLLENYLRFAICKDDDVLDDAVERLKGLKPYISI